MKSIFYQAKYKIIILTLLVGLPIVTIYLIQATSQSIENSVNQEISRTTQIIAFEQESWVFRTRQLLETLSYTSEVKSGNTKTCTEFLTNIITLYPHYTNLGVISLDGNVWCSVVPLMGEVNLADRSWFKKVTKDQTFTIGEFQFGVISKKNIVVFSSPVFDSKNQIKYIVSAGLDLRWLQEVSEQLDLPEGSVTFVIDRKGLILSRTPNGEDWVGKSFPDSILLKEILTSKTGTFETAGLDGVERIFSFTSLSGLSNDIFSVIGIPKSFVNAQIRNIAYNYLALLALFLIVFSIIFWGYKRQKEQSA